MAMRGGKKISDYQINGNVRRVLAGRNVDLKDLHYRSTNGAVDITGRLRFREVKSIPEVMKELLILEELISDVKGVRRVNFNLEDWEKANSGQYVRRLEGESPQSEDS